MTVKTSWVAGLMSKNAKTFVVNPLGTSSGSARDPELVPQRSSLAHGERVAGRDTFSVHPKELLVPERDITWSEVVLAQAPEVARYARMAARTIPVALLQLLDHL